MRPPRMPLRCVWIEQTDNPSARDALILSEAVDTLHVSRAPASFVHASQLPMPFDLENFTHRLLAESLFYDLEYGLVGSVSLIETEEEREAYIASFMPDDGTYMIEEATAWEDAPVIEEEEDVAYALATESTVYGTYDIPEVAANALLSLGREHDLLPSVTVLFEDEEL